MRFFFVIKGSILRTYFLSLSPFKGYALVFCINSPPSSQHHNHHYHLHFRHHIHPSLDGAFSSHATPIIDPIDAHSQSSLAVFFIWWISLPYPLPPTDSMLDPFNSLLLCIFHNLCPSHPEPPLLHLHHLLKLARTSHKVILGRCMSVKSVGKGGADSIMPPHPGGVEGVGSFELMMGWSLSFGCGDCVTEGGRRYW